MNERVWEFNRELLSLIEEMDSPSAGLFYAFNLLTEPGSMMFIIER